MKLKQLPEDFYVKELMDSNFVSSGDYSCFSLRKNGWGTLAAIFAIANCLKAPVKAFGIAGMKDKRAVTEQYVSVYRISREQIEKVKIKDVGLNFLGYLKDRILLGDHKGNHFRIVARDFDERKEIKQGKILNLYDYQRFGKKGENIGLGRALIKGDYKTFCDGFNLKVENNDYIGAIRRINRRVLRFIISSYQSHLWNGVARKLVNEYEQIPVLGFLTEFGGEIKDAYCRLMKEEGISKEDFLMKKIPELSSEGGTRKVFVELSNLSWKWDEDEVNKGKFKCILEFDLGKGQYATHVVKSLFSES